MISEITARAKPNSRVQYYLSGALFAVGIVGFLLTNLLDRYVGVAQFCAILPIIAAIFILVKYCLSTPTYDISFNDEGRAMLVVRSVSGRRFHPVCFAFLAHVTSVTAETPEERGAHKTASGCALYTSTASMRPTLTYRVSADTHGSHKEIVLECSEEFANLIRTYAIEAREIEKDSEDDED